MIRLSSHISSVLPCPYLDGCTACYEQFYATAVSSSELEALLDAGWRKFGRYFFRPACDCGSCMPLRINTKSFEPSKSQRRVMRRNTHTTHTMSNLTWRDELYDLYLKHSIKKFGTHPDPEDFRQSFFFRSCPALQCEYFHQGQLIGAGFLDKSSSSLSSVYFFYDPDFHHLSPGIFSVLNEIDLCRALGLQYYYLGFYVPGNRHMAYKKDFYPHEIRNNVDGAWRTGLPSDKMTGQDYC